MNAKMEEVMSVVRSCLLTSKHGVTINKLNQDYRLMEDRNIPFQSMGFPTLEAFVQRIPGVRLIRRGAEQWVEVVPTKESAHIARLVAGQKDSSSRRRPQRSRQIPPARRPQAMFKSLRSADTNQARSRSWNTGNSNNRGTSNNMTPAPQSTNHAMRPLMQQPVRPPLMSLPRSPPTTPRYTGATNAQMASPSKRMVDRNIQPHEYLDYERNSRAGKSAPPAINKPKTMTTATAEISRTIKNQERAEPEVPLTPISPGSGVLWPAGNFRTGLGPAIAASPAPEPIATVPVPISWPARQPMARMKLCDRLIIPQTASLCNSTVTNGNGGIQVTFTNNGGGGDCPVTPISPSQDPRDELKKVLLDLNLQDPVYKTRPVVTKSGVESGFYGLVLIGSLKFSSYPEEAKTESKAQILAAQRAIDELAKERGSKFLLRETSDKKLIKNRVLSIVDQHNGVFTHKVAAYYQELYNENLPEDWIKDVEKWAEVTMDKGADNSTILRRRTAYNDKVPGLPSPKADKVLLNPIGRVEPGMLQLPEEHYWIAYVTTVISSEEIWVRLVGENYSEQFELLTYDMAQHYITAKQAVSETIEAGGYYALKDEDCWHRVRVVECDATTGEADVFFIDIGEEDTVSMSHLLLLDKKFCMLSGQAMKVSLAGLEHFSDCSEVLPCIEKILLDGVFYVEDLSRDITDDGPVANIVFYDTSGSEDINVNELIAKKILHHLITNVPRFETEGHVTEVHISHVEDNGDVFIQVKSEGMKFLMKMLNKLTQNDLTAEELEKSTLKITDRTKVYLARCPRTGDWYRAKIIDETGAPRGIKMFLIDFGRKMIVDSKNILELDILSQFLAKYPAQAMKVRLHNVDLPMFDDKMVARLAELAPPSELILLKVVKPSYRGSPPTVELFKRIQPDNVLIAINNTLALEPELSKTNGDGNNNVRPRKRIERTNSRVSGEPEEVAKALKPPRISGIGEYFDVHVTMAANPGNFTIQPHESRGALQMMMKQLQEACLAHVGPQPSLESIREGRLYAAKHVDGNWYRVCVSNVINEHMVTVYFCDYGDVTVITLDKLQRLQKQFLDLPYQAIKARLVGIQPTNMDWAVEDTVRFQDLVVERDFVSVVVESAADKHSPGDTVLGLKLIDVSTEHDINIGQLLVNEGRATYTD